MRILLTGSEGQLGHDVREQLSGHHELFCPSHLEMDITDDSAVTEHFSRINPEFVIHCAAWTDVDGAERHVEECNLVNVEGTRNLVNQCARLAIPILYISTDYVFDGSGSESWKVDDPCRPLNVYGTSKLLGENIVKEYDKHFIVRISWAFGRNGRNFIKVMLELAKKTDRVKVVNDQWGSPTYTSDLAILISEMIGTDKYGTYHAHNEGVCSWYELAVHSFRVAGLDTIVEQISSKEYPQKVVRPSNSRLDTSSLTKNGFNLLPDWKDAVERFIRSLN